MSRSRYNIGQGTRRSGFSNLALAKSMIVLILTSKLQSNLLFVFPTGKYNAFYHVLPRNSLKRSREAG